MNAEVDPVDLGKVTERGTARERSFLSREETAEGFLMLGTRPLDLMLRKETRLSVSFPILKTRLGISTGLPFCSRWKTGSPGKARCKIVGLHQRTMTDGCLGFGLHPVVQFHVPVQIFGGWGSLWHRKPRASVVPCIQRWNTV